MRSSFRVGLAAWLLCLAFAVTGCSNVTLYSNLPEPEINEMMAVLQRQGIDCAKEPGTEGTWTMTVPSRSFAEAVRVIKIAQRGQECRITALQQFLDHQDGGLRHDASSG